MSVNAMMYRKQPEVIQKQSALIFSRGLREEETQHIVHFIQYTLCNINCTLYTAYSTVYTIHYTVYTVNNVQQS